MAASSTVSLILEGQSDGATAALDAVQGQLGGVGSMLGGFMPGGVVAAGAVAGFAAIGGAALAVGGAALSMSEEFDGAMNRFAAQTGTAQDELGDFRDIATDIFTNNWGDSLGDVADAMAIVNQTTGAGGEELESMTQSALIMRDVFDLDVGESISTVQTLMSEFGLSSEQAFDFVTTGIQNGLNSQGDFLDSIGEYSNLFSDAGASADQFYSLMETGAAGGALGTDKISDAFKEFQIRFLEGGDEMQAAVADLTGDSWEMFMQEIQAGDSTVTDVFGTMTRLLGDVEDQTARNALQVALFGTQAEDLGVGFADGLDLASTSLADMEGATSAAGDAVSQGLGPALETFKRTVAVSLLPLGDWLGEMLTQATPHLESLGNWLGVVIPQATETLRTFWVEQAWPAILQVGEWLSVNVFPHLETLGVFLGENVPIALETLRTFWVDEAWPVIQDTIMAFWEFAEPTIFTPLGEWLGEKIPVALETLRAFWVDVAWPAIKENFITQWEEIKVGLDLIQTLFNETLPLAVETMKGVWQASWLSISSAVSAAMDVMTPIFDGIKNFASWLAGTVFSIDFELPELPEWMKTESPMKLHTAFVNFGDYLDSHTFEPKFNTSSYENAGFDPNPSLNRFSQPQTFNSPPINTPNRTQRDEPRQIVVNIYDTAAAALLLDYLEATA